MTERTGSGDTEARRGELPAGRTLSVVVSGMAGGLLVGTVALVLAIKVSGAFGWLLASVVVTLWFWLMLWLALREGHSRAWSVGAATLSVVWALAGTLALLVLTGGGG